MKRILLNYREHYNLTPLNFAQVLHPLHFKNFQLNPWHYILLQCDPSTPMSPLLTPLTTVNKWQKPLPSYLWPFPIRHMPSPTPRLSWYPSLASSLLTMLSPMLLGMSLPSSLLVMLPISGRANIFLTLDVIWPFHFLDHTLL